MRHENGAPPQRPASNQISGTTTDTRATKGTGEVFPSGFAASLDTAQLRRVSENIDAAVQSALRELAPSALVDDMRTAAAECRIELRKRLAQTALNDVADLAAHVHQVR